MKEGDKMIINKIINNNIIRSIDENRNEIIVMGRGIAFQKSKGDFVDEKNIEKIFYMKDDAVNDKFMQLLKDIPREIISITDDVIHLAKKELNKEMNDGIYITLMDHINYAVERYLQGISPQNAMLWEIKRFYRDELEVAKHAIQMINSKLMTNLNEDEAGFIALHFVNAELNSEMKDVTMITNIMQESLNIIKYYFKVVFEEDSVEFYRLLTHLKFFAQRIVNEIFDERSDEFLFQIVTERYPKAYDCVTMIEKHIKKTYEYDLTMNEKLYLTMHIARLVNK